MTNRTRSGEVSTGYSQGSGFRTQSLGAAGSVVAHASGVNLGRQVGETFILVNVPDVADVKIKSYAGARTAGNGYAVVPNALPYRTNWVTLDTRDLGGDIEIENAT